MRHEQVFEQIIQQKAKRRENIFLTGNERKLQKQD